MNDDRSHPISVFNKTMKGIVIAGIAIVGITGTELTLNSLEPQKPPHYTDSIEVLLEKLNTPDDSQREKVLLEIASRGPAAKVALPALINLLTDKNPFIRRRAVEVMRSMPKELGPAIPYLIKALSDSFSWVRSGAASTLQTIGPPTANPAIPALITALKDEDDSVQNSAAYALASIGPAAKSAVPTLIEVLPHLPAAAPALGSIGPAATSALPALTTAFRTADLENKAAFPEIFVKIGPSSIPVLVGILKTEDPATQRFAAYALLYFGPSAAMASPALIEILRKTNVLEKGDMEKMSSEITGLHDAACDALWRIAPKKAEAISESLDCTEPIAD